MKYINLKALFYLYMINFINEKEDHKKDKYWKN
jgi:hypothetical protein